MSIRLRDDRDTLAEYLERLEVVTGLPYEQLEKDFWLTEALRGVAAAADAVGLQVYFKGGTSLSKVYGLIERFSEDVDVLVALPKSDELMSANQRGRALEQLGEGAQQATGLPAQTDPNKTRKGEARAVLLRYRDPDDGVGLAPLRPEGVLVELGRWGGSQPHRRAEVASILAERADELGVALFEEQAPVAVNVVEPVRTAVEKLMLLVAAAADADEQRRASVARHYYDLWCLLRHEPTAEQLRRPGHVVDIAGEVFVNTHYFKPDAFKDTVRERPLEGFRASAAFDPADPQLEVTRATFETVVLDGLLWPTATHRPSFEECCDAVSSFPGGL